MRDRATRDRIVESTDRSLLVEAAAGTGKTTLVIDRILRGIRDDNLRLADTVAITFTEKAAGELEERLRTELGRTLQLPDLPSDVRRRFREAAEELDRAHISTIHSFCARILREKPAEAGVDPDFEVLDETPALLLKEACWREWMEGQVAEGPTALVEALRAGVNGETLKKLAYALAAAPELLELPGFSLPEPSADAGPLVEEALRAARDAAEVCRGFMRGRGNKDSRALREAAEGILAAGSQRPEAVRRLAYRMAGADPAEALRSFGKSKDEARGPLDAFHLAARRLGADLAAGVFQWVRGFVEHYQRAKAARSALDFQDLLLLSARLVRRDRDARRYFQRRFGAFFVDEFQDTDPLQAELIAYLCEDPSGPAADRFEQVRLRQGALVAVGDPKQSIYRFRRADVQTYEQFKGLFGGGGVERVHCNFRSRAPLLEWFNDLFGRVFEPPADGRVYQAEHVPLEPGLERQQGRGPAVVAVCPGSEVEAEGWKADAARAREAQCLARVVSDAVEGRLRLPGAEGLSYGDFAFLFRAMTSVDIYEEALEARAVPFRVIGGKHFYRRSQTDETLTLLRAVDDPLDEAAVVGALRSSYFGISDEELLRHRLGGGEWDYLQPGGPPGPVREAMDRLVDWHGRRNRVPPHALLADIFDVTKAPQAYMLKPAGPQRAATLEQLRRRLRGLGRATRTFGALVRHLSSMAQEDLPEEESAVVEPGDDFVQLLSMHKAKGLEFPVVVLPDLGRDSPGGGRAGALLFSRRDGRVGLRVQKGIETDGYGELEEVELGNDLAEDRRLLYVACTRAKRWLVLPLGWWTGRGDENFHGLLQRSGLFAPQGEVPYGAELNGVFYLDTNGWSDESALSVRQRPIDEEDRAAVEPQLAARQSWEEGHRRLVERVSAGERFVLPSALAGEPEPSDLDEAPGGAAARDVGTLFHSIMRAVPLEPGTGVEDAARGLAAVEADALGLGEDAVEEAVTLVASALANEEFRAVLDGAARVGREVPFCVPLASLDGFADDATGYVEGWIDLVVSRPGSTLVLDYKTDRSVEEGRYWPQLALYALAARACGGAEGELDLALFFVRQGVILRRSLDDGLVAEVAARVAADPLRPRGPAQ